MSTRTVSARTVRRLIACAVWTLMAAVEAVAAQDTTVTIRAGLALDGRGGAARNTAVVVQGSRIAKIDPGAREATYDLSDLTLLPGLIDTHVHIANHFGRDGRAATSGETPAEAMLYAVENAYATLMAGFTTVQSIGSPSDRELRDAITRGQIPGPRILTSLRPVTETTGTPAQIREFVRKVAAEGADLIKIFASKSIREGGGRTLTDEQIEAACREARALGLRQWVHAHAADAVEAAARAGCMAVTHGSQVTDEAIQLMAERGTFFEPNIGLVSQNYLANKARFLGIGNYTEEGFAFMEKGIPVKLAMFKRAMADRKLKIVMGTDAVAGAHGRNAEEIIYRVQQAGQAPMDALVAATSLAAEALGLNDRTGAIAADMEADLIAVEGDPLRDITALRRVRFVMQGGKVYKNLAGR